MEIRFFEPMRIPTVTHNDLKVRTRKTAGGKTHFVGKSDRLRDAEAKWEAFLGQHTPKRPLEGALLLDLEFVFARDGLAEHELVPMIDKPDRDNLEKTVQDAMERLGWFATGDQQIVVGRTTKWWSSFEGVFVRVKEIDGIDDLEREWSL